MAVLRDGTWDGLGSLDKLDLAHNELRIIRKGLWKGLDHVTELDLSSNHVEFIQDDAFENMLAWSPVFSKPDRQSADVNLLRRPFNPVFVHLHEPRFGSEREPVQVRR